MTGNNSPIVKHDSGFTLINAASARLMDDAKGGQ